MSDTTVPGATDLHTEPRVIFSVLTMFLMT